LPHPDSTDCLRPVPPTAGHSLEGPDQETAGSTKPELYCRVRSADERVLVWAAGLPEQQSAIAPCAETERWRWLSYPDLRWDKGLAAFVR
jgi:hypothetical protein